MKGETRWKIKGENVCEKSKNNANEAIEQLSVLLSLGKINPA